MKIKDIDQINKKLDAHLKQIATSRNKIDETISELEGLRSDWDDAVVADAAPIDDGERIYGPEEEAAGRKIVEAGLKNELEVLCEAARRSEARQGNRLVKSITDAFRAQQAEAAPASCGWKDCPHGAECVHAKAEAAEPVAKILASVKPRRPFDNGQPEGYLESDTDWIGNNMETIIALLEYAVAQPSATAEPTDRWTMFIVRKPGMAPRLGRPIGDTVTSLREWYAANPDAEIDVVTVWADGIGCQWVESGRELLAVYDHENDHRAAIAASRAQSNKETS